MKLQINGKVAHVSIRHMTTKEFTENFENIAQNSCLSWANPKRVTVAQVTYENLTSVGVSYCHPNDQFNRRGGSSRSLQKAMSQHPSLKGYYNKGTRRQIYSQIFRSSPSPYAELDKLIRGRPQLAKELIEKAKEILKGNNDA